MRIMPATTSAASAETVREQQAPRSAHGRCTELILSQYFLMSIVLAYISAQYKNMDWAMDIMRRLFAGLGPPMLASSLLSATIATATLSHAPWMCSLWVRCVSSFTSG